ncbi:MAG: ComF family protein [Chloroflexi bacterium]|nr:ComF family protein [Chloroflexota bacterium]
MPHLFPGASLRKGLLDLFFPPRCAGCGRFGHLFCPSCRRSLRPIRPPLCNAGGRPLSQGGSCYSCPKDKPILGGIRAVYAFEGALRRAIHAFKYRGVRSLADPLGKLLAQYLAENPLPGDFLVPVPLHRHRLRERGYNQAALLAVELGRCAHLPVAEGALRRRRLGSPQTQAATAEERYGNVAGAFQGLPGAWIGKDILLVDDVCTTGATLRACGDALGAIGAGSVWGLVLAREI